MALDSTLKKGAQARFKAEAERRRLVACGVFGRVGEDHPKAKLTDEQIEAMRAEYEHGQEVGPPVGYRALAKKYGVSRTHVRDLVQFKRRNTPPDRWKRIDN